MLEQKGKSNGYSNIYKFCSVCDSVVQFSKGASKHQVLHCLWEHCERCFWKHFLLKATQSQWKKTWSYIFCSRAKRLTYQELQEALGDLIHLGCPFHQVSLVDQNQEVQEVLCLQEDLVFPGHPEFPFLLWMQHCPEKRKSKMRKRNTYLLVKEQRTSSVLFWNSATFILLTLTAISCLHLINIER